MSCETCADHGVVKVNWNDAPEDYAVCLCQAGRNLRVTTNGYAKSVTPLWLLWAAREQVDPARVVMLEDIATPEEMQVWGFAEAEPGERLEQRLMALGKTKAKPRL